MNKKFSAFSLMEILAVFLIIFSLYMYMNKDTFEREPYIATAQASFSTLLNLSGNIMENGGFAGKFSSENDIIDYIVQNFKPIKYCYNSQDEGCWSKNWLWGNRIKPGAQLKTLQFLTVDFISRDCAYSNNIPNTCAFVYVDTNGGVSPNEVGKDILLFYMTKQGFIPAGVDGDSVTSSSSCDLEKELYNWGCTAKLLGVH